MEFNREKKYYNERMGLLTQSLRLDFDELKDFFLKTYTYFENKEYFQLAIKGIWNYPDHGNAIMIEPPSFSPSVEVYFANKLQSIEVWPIYLNIDNYDEVTLFTVMEILYEHIAEYDFEKERINREYPRQEYSEYVNNILKAYGDGYYLEPTNGFIMNLPNKALQEQLCEAYDCLPKDVEEKLSSAFKMYYRFDSGMEEKKKAINILADTLEAVRENVKQIFDKNHINKRPHDKLIFDIVNNFNIRHNNEKQKKATAPRHYDLI